MQQKLTTILLALTLLFSITTLSSCQPETKSSEPTLEQKVGQLLMIGFRGYQAADTSHIVRDIEEYNLGGVILFDYDVPAGRAVRNIDSAEQVRTLNKSLQQLSSTPLLVAIDQEGGRVARLKPSRGFPETVSAEYLGTLNNADTTHAYAEEQTALLRNLGFNVNFAPVVDLNTNPDNPVIGSIERSYGADPERVTKHASIVIEEHLQHDILPVIKHFPGHGSAWNDSHIGMADVTDTWVDTELAPYRSLSETDYHFGVMTAHVLNRKLDEELPATLSSTIQTGLLRNSIGFDGLLFSDDMQMEAIRSFYGLEFALEHALNAGVDMLVFGNNSVYQPNIVPDAISIILKLVENGSVSEQRIDEAYNRVMQTKRMLNLTD